MSEKFHWAVSALVMTAMIVSPLVVYGLLGLVASLLYLLVWWILMEVLDSKLW
jgi:hypothetical protein